MSTLRRVLVLAVWTVLAALLAGLAVVDPFNLRHAQWFTAGAVLLVIILAAATLTVAVKVYPARAFVLVLGGILALGWAVIAWLVIGLDESGEPVSEVASGAQRLVVLTGNASFSPDPLTWVVLRAGDGPFAQESLVWQGEPEGAGPDEVAFHGENEVQVRVATCVLTFQVEPITLEMEGPGEAC